jgi:hypothetical protein
MRILEIITEAGLSNTGLRKQYLDNLIALITKNTPIILTPSAANKYGKSVVIDPAESARIQSILDAGGGQTNKRNYLQLDPIGKIKLTTTDKKGNPQFINLSDIEKSPEIKGKDSDYNIGDIGEIALGIAAGAKFLAGGADVGEAEFVNLSKQMTRENVTGKKGQLLDSLKLTFHGPLKHQNGKIDEVDIMIIAPGRSVNAFVDLINGIESNQNFPGEVKGTILSALQYARDAEKIKAGIEQTAADPNTNTIEVVCDGVSDQRGTKADLVLHIDGKKINLISAKTGKSQLGQASGHDWNKQVTFFSTVFGVNISTFKDKWGTTNEEHIAAMQGVYSQLVIPKIQKLTGGNSVQAEAALVKSISDGLIRYSNNYDQNTSKVETVDIVKLSTQPGTPGFNLLRVDSRLESALMKTDLIGSSTPNNQGVQVYGNVGGKSLLLFKVRSYHSPAGDVFRTIIEGGPLLEQLAVVTPNTVSTPSPVSTAPVQQPPAGGTPGIRNQTKQPGSKELVGQDPATAASTGPRI